MTYTRSIKEGQTWRSRDPRDHGRTVRIITVPESANKAGNYGRVLVLSGPRRYLIQALTLHERYTFVSEAAS